MFPVYAGMALSGVALIFGSTSVPRVYGDGPLRTRLNGTPTIDCLEAVFPVCTGMALFERVRSHEPRSVPRVYGDGPTSSHILIKSL